MILTNSFGALGNLPEESPSGIYRMAEGAAQAAYVAGGSPVFVTQITPVNVSAADSPRVPAAIVEALNYWFRPPGGWGEGFVAHESAWNPTGTLWVRFTDPNEQTGVRRDAALRAAMARAERTLGGNARLLLPGEQVATPDAETPPSTDGETPPAPDASLATRQSSGVFTTPVVVALIAGAAVLGGLYYYQRRKPAGVDQSV